MAAAPAVPAPPGNLDPAFTRLPFNQWLTQGKQTQIHWSVDIPPAELSTHQRLIMRIAIHVDGRELEKRGPGDLTALLQFQDGDGRTWQNHMALRREDMLPGVQTRDLSLFQYAFVLPGDYTLSIALCDTATLEHSVTLRKVHVAPLKTDPLPDSWTGLPSVEFIPGVTEPPDVWYLPGNGNRLRLPVATHRPVHVQILVNTTPTQRSAGSVTALRSNMSVLIPALKILSQMEVANGSIDAALLDLTHRRVSFEQKNVQALNWDAMRKLFVDIKPGIIDVRALEGQWKMRRFFWDEVNRRLNANDGSRNVVIVLSGPAFLDDQEPVETTALPSDPERRLFYIRYRTIPPRPQHPRLRPGARGPLLTPPPTYPMPVDDLEHTVEPLNARLFDATSSEQFRRILAAVIDQMSEN
ncbi:MAG: hypothetical protein ABSB15_13890 [Bryobacteraceae bacterium]